MKRYRGDLRRLLAIFHSPKRTFAEIGDTPGVAVVVAALLLLLALPIARNVMTGNPAFGNLDAEQLLIQPVVVIGWPFVVSALYVFVFDLFGAEARYRVILSVTLHAMWVISVASVVLVVVHSLAGAVPFEMREYLVSSIGLDERAARDVARMLNPLEIGRLLFIGLGFAIALRIAPWMSFAVVLAGWFGFHSLPLLRFLLF